MNSTFKTLISKLIGAAICCTFLLLSGCQQNPDSLPGFDNVTQNWEYMERSDLSLAIFATYLEWEKRWGDKDKLVFNSIQNINVKWSDDLGTILLRGRTATVTGITLGYDIGLKINPKCQISCTAFTHEFVHYALWSISGEPDPDHEEDTYKGWTKEHTQWEDDTQQVLKLLGM